MNSEVSPFPGVLISFEGGEGSGKSSHASHLFRYLKSYRYEVLFTREPGGTPLGEELREVLLNREWSPPLDPWQELFLFLVARSALIREIIAPALACGQIVILDRYFDSSVAYQGGGSGLDPALIAQLNQLVVGVYRPQLTFLLDVSPQVGLLRSGKSRAQYNLWEPAEPLLTDRFETRTLQFHQQVREAYLDLAEQEPARFRVINTERDEVEVMLEIRKLALELIAEKGIQPRL